MCAQPADSARVTLPKCGQASADARLTLRNGAAIRHVEPPRRSTPVVSLVGMVTSDDVEVRVQGAFTEGDHSTITVMRGGHQLWRASDGHEHLIVEHGIVVAKIRREMLQDGDELVLHVVGAGPFEWQGDVAVRDVDETIVSVTWRGP